MNQFKKIVTMWKRHEARVNMRYLLQYTDGGAHEDVLRIAEAKNLL